MQDAQHDATQNAQHEGTWATLAEAASLLGCSVDTVRRRIRRGELHAMQDAGRHGPTWRVLLSTPPSTVPTVGSTPSSTPSVNGSTPSMTPSVDEVGPALLEALRLLDALRQENRDLAGQVGYLQARVQVHEETIRALTAPEQPQEPPTAPDPADSTPEPSAPLPWPIPPHPNWSTATPWLVLVAILGAAVVVGWWPR
jgi:excisionase family DNA binding protein